MAHIGPNEIYTQLTFNADRQAANNQASPGNQDMLGTIWNDLDTALGTRRYVFCENAGTNTAATTNGLLVYWYDNYGRKVSTSLTDGTRNTVRGVGTSTAISIGNCGWFQTDGYHSAVDAGSGTFALGTAGISDSTAGRVIPVTPGNAPTYNVVGTALAASAASEVAMQLHVGRWGIGS